MSGLLLDTHILVWLATGSERLPVAARQAIAAAPESLFVSAISAFELALKCRHGELELPLPVQAWWERVLAQHGICELPVTARVAMASVDVDLPHRDPADRIIAATAIDAGLQVVTVDAKLAECRGLAVLG
jgi:PIN domain nuclease of toxin-antitoxin system